MSDTKLKCPFCQQELVRHWGMEEPALYCCDNPKCSRGGVATEQSWQALIDTKKKLDIAVNSLKEINKNAFLTDYAQSVLDKALAKITALEQKDVK